MKREIKFRAWHKGQNEMFYPMGTIDRKGYSSLYPTQIFERFYGEELMQSTSLLDKNNKEIYEGDILKFKQYVGGNLVEYSYETLYVVWNRLNAGFIFRKTDNIGGRQPFDSYENHELEIIGNIHENPELLK